MTGASYANSDMSRLTTMLSRVGARFERSYGPNAIRLIEIGNIVFEFKDDGTLLEARVVDAAEPPKE